MLPSMAFLFYGENRGIYFCGGPYLFFNRMPAKGKQGYSEDGPDHRWGDVYWVNANVIEELKLKELK
jgi:hypothetical protein